MTLVLCFLAALCEGFDVQAAGVAAGGISGEFGPTPAQLGYFFSGGNAGLLLGALIGGRLADVLGRQRILCASIAMFGIFSLATALAFNVESLIAMRILTGVGLGGAMPNLMALAAEASRAGTRNASMGMTFVGLPAGGAIASLIVFILAAEDWRIVFLVGGALPLLIALAMTLYMPPAPASAESAANPSVQRLSAVREVIGEGRAARTALLWLGFFLVQLTFQLLLNWLPLLMQARGLSKNAAAIAQVGFNLGGAALALLIGFLLDKPIRRASIVAMVVVLPSALLLLATSPARSDVVIALMVLLGSITAMQLTLYSVAAELYPAAVRGTGMGASVGTGRLGAVAGPAIAAVLLGAGRTPEQVLTGILPIVVACAACVGILGISARGSSRAGVRRERPG